MKIFLSILTFFMMLMFHQGVSFGADVHNPTPGSPLTIDATGNVPGSDIFVFHPSPYGMIAVKTRDDCFAAAAVNSQALGVEGGREYGMAADSKKVFNRSVLSLSGLTQPITSSSAAFSGYYIQ